MEMHELKTKWGKYCDTDKLVLEMQRWLNAKSMRNTTQGICSMLDTYFTNKEELINLFANSNNYIGDMRIMIDTSIARYGDRNKIYSFVHNFPNKVESKKAIIKTVDDKGKTLRDYIHVGRKTVSVEDLANGKIEKVEFAKWHEVFDNDGSTIKSVNEYDEFYRVMNNLQNIYCSSISKDAAERMNNINSSLKLAQGIKTSRAFNKVCTAYGVDKLPKYNKLFAEYADMVADGSQSIKFYISLNPLDYLNMSIGKSWTSCHAPNSGHFGGTVSYMLDKVSIITFVHHKIPTDIVSEGKIYRNMFHYKDGVLLQSRIYPQGNDGCVNLYDEFRNIVQKELAEDLGVQNNWKASKKLEVTSIGTQYPDYRYNSNISYVGSTQGATRMEIGHINVCPYCGREEATSYSLIYHRNCTL